MATINQRRLLVSANHTIDCLYLTGAIGSNQHRLVLVHRKQGQIIDACDYGMDEHAAMVADVLDEEYPDREYDTSDAPTRPIRCDWVVSSGGDMAIELYRDKVRLIRKPSGQYEIHGNPNTAADTTTQRPEPDSNGCGLLGGDATTNAAGGIATAAIVPAAAIHSAAAVSASL